MSNSSVGGDNRSPIDDFEELALEQAQKVPTKSDVERVERRSSRFSQAAIAISVLIALVSLVFGIWNMTDIARNEASNALTQEGIDSLKAANKKLSEQGLQEIPLPRDGDPIDADAIAAAAAALMYDRISNDPTFKGPRGETGVSGPPGASCTPQVPGCTGPPGQPGQNGSQGQQGGTGPEGPPVSDERVLAGVSAYCTSNPERCQGAQGVPGPQGPAGPPGAAGPPGVVCPAGTTLVIQGTPDLSGDYHVVCRP